MATCENCGCTECVPGQPCPDCGTMTPADAPTTETETTNATVVVNIEVSGQQNSRLDFDREARVASGFELRRAADSPLVEFRGYASVTNHPYDVYGGPDAGGWTETITRGAFKRTLGTGENRALLYAHDNSRVLATTRAGTLRMNEDDVGLYVSASLNTRVGWVGDLVAQIEDGTVDEMSIGFRAMTDPRKQWNSDYTQRSIDEVRLYEATIVWAGANGATVGTIDRSLDAVREARTALSVPRLDRVAIAAAAARARL